MTIIKNHFEVFLVTSKKQENCIIESKVGLGQYTHTVLLRNLTKIELSKPGLL
jgi:hypothetical protein